MKIRQNKFNKGDRVVCVEDYLPYSGCFLEEGSVYVVDIVDEFGFVGLKGVDEEGVTCWSDSRFDLYLPPNNFNEDLFII